MTEKSEQQNCMPKSALQLSEEELDFLALYRLHPEIQQKLQDEAKRVCSENDEE